MQLFNMSNKSTRKYFSLHRCIQQAGGRAMRAQMKQLPQARKVPWKNNLRIDQGKRMSQAKRQGARPENRTAHTVPDMITKYPAARDKASLHSDNAEYRRLYSADYTHHPAEQINRGSTFQLGRYAQRRRMIATACPIISSG